MNQLPIDFEAARERAELGIQRAVDATEASTPEWCDIACEKLRAFAVQQPGVFTIERARASFEQSIPKPHDLRTWGAVTRMARSRKYIEPVAGAFLPAASSNGSPKPVYRRGASA